MTLALSLEMTLFSIAFLIASSQKRGANSSAAVTNFMSLMNFNPHLSRNSKFLLEQD